MPSVEIEFSGILESKFGSSKTEFRTTTKTLSTDRPISEYFDFMGSITFKPNGVGTVRTEYYYYGALSEKDGEIKIAFQSSGKDPRQMKLIELTVGGPPATIVNQSNGNRLNLRAIENSSPDTKKKQQNH